MTSGVSESQFYMWRTLFSVAHADNVVTDEEVEFMAHVMEDIEFSEQQDRILKDDIINPKDVDEMFRGISDERDRIQFFNFARDLVWVDGDFGSEEQSVMIRLQQAQFKGANIDTLQAHVSLEFEDDNEEAYISPDRQRGTNFVRGGSFRDVLSSFKRLISK